MGGAPSFMQLFIITTITITIILIHPNIIAKASDDTRETPPQIPKLDHGDDNGGIATTSPMVSTHSDQDHQGKKLEPFKSRTMIVVCVLTTVCSIYFMILLCIKHCIGDNTSSTSRNQNNSYEERKNSGVERSVVESLPIFRFGSLRGQKEGLECAICLKRFEDHELLRLLPKCNHAFHVECVDMWLNVHSTCPLCRDKVDPEDVLVDQQHLPSPSLTRHQSNNHNEGLDINNTTQPQPQPQPQSHNLNQGISRRHSWVGKSDDGFIEINLEKIEETSSYRRSLDDSVMRRIEGKREDGKLVTQENEREKKSEEDHRLEHHIIVSPTTKSSQCAGVHQKRWSNVEPCDLLCLMSEMIISETCATTSSSQQQHHSRRVSLPWDTRGGGSVRNRNVGDEMEKGGVNMNMRSVSETTGMNRNRGTSREEEE